MAVKFGEKIKVEIYGSSHDDNIGVKIEGLPPGLIIERSRLQSFLDRRAPGRNPWSSSRKEPDIPEFVSGLTENTLPETNGETLEAIIYNIDRNTSDYSNLTLIPRPGHADYPAWVKYGMIETGGGRFSGRLTAALCIAGGLCLQWLEKKGILIKAHISRIGELADSPINSKSLVNDEFPVISEAQGDKMKKLIAHVSRKGDSIGGEIECIITGLPPGLGSPIFGSIESRLCQTVFAVPAVKGIEFGSGFKVAGMTGTENNDPYTINDGKIETETNNHGGILGGLTSGMPIFFRTAIKPTPSISKEQKSINIHSMTKTKFKINGRHDPCIAARAVPCIEAAAALAIFDICMEEEVI